MGQARGLQRHRTGKSWPERRASHRKARVLSALAEAPLRALEHREEAPLSKDEGSSWKPV